jgi:hypothetical protein
MIGFQYFGGPLTDNNTASHGIAGYHSRHDGSVGNMQIFNSIHLEVAISFEKGRFEKITLGSMTIGG